MSMLAEVSCFLISSRKRRRTLKAKNTITTTARIVQAIRISAPLNKDRPVRRSATSAAARVRDAASVAIAAPMSAARTASRWWSSLLVGDLRPT
jgi:hypothetical protein